MAARPSAATGGSSSPRSRPSARSVSSVGRPSEGPPATTLSRAPLAQPPAARAMCAFAEPTNPAGSASARQRPRFEKPMPGSISTGVTPARNSAKLTAKKSRDGGISTATRSFFLKPARKKPCASSSASRPSSSNVTTSSRWISAGCLARRLPLS